jgi:hypothetical protein
MILPLKYTSLLRVQIVNIHPDGRFSIILVNMTIPINSKIINAVVPLHSSYIHRFLHVVLQLDQTENIVRVGETGVVALHVAVQKNIVPQHGLVVRVVGAAGDHQHDLERRQQGQRDRNRQAPGKLAVGFVPLQRGHVQSVPQGYFFACV